MLRLLVLLAIVVAAASALLLPRAAEAKTQVTISPASGPPGTRVEVSGFGFVGDVQIVATGYHTIPPATTGGAFLEDDYHFPKMVVLASIEAANGEFEVEIEIPATSELTAALGFTPKAIDIIAMQELEPGDSRDSGTFVTGATFEITAPALPAAGARPGRDGGTAVAAAGALLALTVSAFAFAGWRMRHNASV